MSLVDALSGTGSCQGIGFQRGADTFDNIGNVDTEGEGAAIDESEVKVTFASFAGKIFSDGDVRLRRHFLGCESGYFTQLADTFRHFPDFEIQAAHLTHFFIPFARLLCRFTGVNADFAITFPESTGNQTAVFEQKRVSELASLNLSV